jgi:serine/threonine-protein kinase
MHNVINGRIPSPRTVFQDVPQRLEEICMKALAPEPADRYATAAELQNDLEGWLAGDVVSNRTIGQFVSSLFADERAKTHEIIEQQLARLSGAPNTDGSHSTAIGIPYIAMGAATSTDSFPRGDGSTPTARRPRVRAVVAIAMLGIAATIVASTVLRKASPTEISSDRAPLPSDTSSRQTGAAPDLSPDSGITEVAVKLSASPTKAKLYLDNQPLPSNPYLGNVPLDSARHSIRAEAAGYRSEERSLVFKDHTELTLNLEPAKSVARPPAQPRPATSHAPTVATSSPPKVNCNPPYIIDDTGIRKLKPECISAGQK